MGGGGGRAALGLRRWGGVFDEYSQAASGETVVNHLFSSCLCAFWALLALPVAAMAPAVLLICLAPGACSGQFNMANARLLYH